MRLSIITINYNNLEGLTKTFKSVVSQTFADYEWIIIDGGSTDGSKEFIEANQDRFSYWVSEPDRGIYHAMNKGIRQAHGEYLSFMNSGDYYATDTTLCDVFDTKHNADILFGYMLGERRLNIFSTEVMSDNISWYNLCSTSIPHQASFIRRSLFDCVGMYDESFEVTGDCKFFLEAILRHGANYEFMPIVVAIFEGNGKSARMDLSEEFARQRIGVLPDYITERDVQILRWMDLLRISMVGYFLFRIALLTAHQQKRLRTWRLRHKLKKQLSG